MLRGQDILIAIKLLSAEENWSYQLLADQLGISASQCHAGYKRLEGARLVDAKMRIPIRASVLEFLVHGVKYVLPAMPDGEARGIPTGHAAPILASKLVGADKPYVWPYEGKGRKGQVKGIAIPPIYKTAPQVALHDEKSYAILALVDSLRIGKAREREVASEELERIIYEK